MSVFKTATKDGVQQSGFIFVKSASTQEVKKIATSADFQVGLSNLPKDLTVTGKATFTQGLSGSLTRLTDDTSYLVAGGNITITSASNGQVTITGATRAPVDATYVVFSSNSTLTSERIITAGSGITITDGGAGGNLTIAATGGGSGDVVGPASATDNAVVRFDLTTGKLIQNSVVTIADTTGDITTPGDIAINGGDLTTTAATMNLVNGATTINLGSTAITRAINIGTNATNVQTINIGTGAAANIISVGSATGAASLTLQSGTGGINVGTSNVARTINIGSDPAGTATTQQTINIGAKNTALGGFNAVNIADEDSHSGHVVNIISSNGTQTTGTSAIQIGTVVADCTVTIGSTTDYSITTLNGGTGGVNINSTHATLADAIIGNATVGEHPKLSYAGFAIFGHSSYDYNTSPGSYALLAVGSAGTKNTWLNAPTGGQIRFANNDTTIGFMDDNEVSLTGKSGTATTSTLGNTVSTSSTVINAGSGSIDIGTSDSIRSINIGKTDTAAQTISIGGGGANTIGIGNFAIGSTTTVSGLTLNMYSSGGTVSIDSAGTGGTVNIDTFGYNSTVNVGTGPAVKTVTVGSTNTTSTTTIQAGSGGITLTGNATLSGDLAVNGGDITTTSATFNLVNAATTINLGSTAVTRAINIGTNATNVQTIGIGTGNAANVISIGSNAASSASVNGGDALNLYADAGAITMDSGGSGGTGTISIGIFGYAQTISVGNTTGATSLAFRAGSGGITFETNVTASGDIAVNGGDITTTAATFNLINAATTINLGSTAVTRAINIGSNATNVQTIGIGNGAAANIITVGSTTGAASLTLQAGTGNFSLTGAAGTTYTIGPAARTGIISIGNSTATNTIEIGNGSIASGAQQTIDVCAANITNNASAYRIINIGTGTGGGTAGAANFTSQNRVLVGKVQSGAGYTAVAIQGDYIWIGKDGATNPTNSLIGFFGTTPVAQQTGGAATADLTYSSNERDMINSMYTALRNYGLLT